VHYPCAVETTGHKNRLALYPSDAEVSETPYTNPEARGHGRVNARLFVLRVKECPLPTYPDGLFPLCGAITRFFLTNPTLPPPRPTSPTATPRIVKHLRRTSSIGPLARIPSSLSSANGGLAGVCVLAHNLLRAADHASQAVRTTGPTRSTTAREPITVPPIRRPRPQADPCTCPRALASPSSENPVGHTIVYSPATPRADDATSPAHPPSQAPPGDTGKLVQTHRSTHAHTIAKPTQLQNQRPRGTPSTIPLVVRGAVSARTDPFFFPFSSPFQFRGVRFFPPHVLP